MDKTPDTPTDESDTKDDGPPIVPGETIHIRAREPILITRAGTTRKYGAWDAEDGDPIGEAWSITEAAVRGLLRRYDWTRVEGEALTSVRADEND